jgi:hypothetical protein
MNKLSKILSSVFGLALLAVGLALPGFSVAAQDLFPDQQLPSPDVSREGVYELFISIAEIAIFILPGIALLFIIFGAFRIITGGESGGQAGWAIIKSTLIGLAVAGLSFLIIGLTTGLLEEIYGGDFLNLG